MAPMVSTPMLTTVHTAPTPWLESALLVTGGTGTRFAAVSQHTAAAWQHAVPDITVVPNGVDTHRWRLGPGGESLVWFGRITPEKAPHLAIAAARRAGRPLVLAGPVSDGDYFDRRILPELGDGVRYAGHLNMPSSLSWWVARQPLWLPPSGMNRTGWSSRKRCRAVPRWWRSPAVAYPKSLCHTVADSFRPETSQPWPPRFQPPRHWKDSTCTAMPSSAVRPRPWSARTSISTAT